MSKCQPSLLAKLDIERREGKGAPNTSERPRALAKGWIPSCKPASSKESPLQGAHVSSQLFLFLLLFLLQRVGLHRPLHPDGFHVLLEAVALHVGIPTLDLVEHSEESQGCGSELVELGR